LVCVCEISFMSVQYLWDVIIHCAGLLLSKVNEDEYILQFSFIS
jgi:hypothetical protein